MWPLIIYALRIDWKDNCAIARFGLKFNYFLKNGDLAACRRSIEQELRLMSFNSAKKFKYMYILKFSIKMPMGGIIKKINYSHV